MKYSGVLLVIINIGQYVFINILYTHTKYIYINNYYIMCMLLKHNNEVGSLNRYRNGRDELSLFLEHLKEMCT